MKKEMTVDLVDIAEVGKETLAAEITFADAKSEDLMNNDEQIDQYMLDLIEGKG